MPLSEDAHYRRCSFQPLYSTVASNEQWREMSAIRVSQTALRVVILGKEQGGVGAFRRIVVEELVHGSQETLPLIRCHRTLAAKIFLQVGHQQFFPHSPALNIA